MAVVSVHLFCCPCKIIVALLLLQAGPCSHVQSTICLIGFFLRFGYNNGHLLHHIYMNECVNSANDIGQQILAPPTCQHKSHEYILQERVVDKVPEPLKVGEDEVNQCRTGLQHDMNVGPKLSCKQKITFQGIFCF